MGARYEGNSLKSVPETGSSPAKRHAWGEEVISKILAKFSPQIRFYLPVPSLGRGVGVRLLLEGGL
jgi:hypothetical protein